MAKKRSFSLLELMIATAVLVVGLVGLLALFITTSELNEISRNLTFAINGAQKVLEEIRDYSFSKILDDYEGYTFEVDGITDNLGVVEVEVEEGSQSDPELLKVTVSVCWRQRGGRVIGEDKDLDGILDPGEDEDGDTVIDSPAQLTTFITSH